MRIGFLFLFAIVIFGSTVAAGIYLLVRLTGRRNATEAPPVLPPNQP